MNLSNIDFSSQAFNADPFPVFTRLREQQAVMWVESGYRGLQGVWFVTRYAEAVALLKDSRVVVDQGSIDPGANGGKSVPVPLWIAHSMIRKDGLDHTRLRALVSGAFTAHFIEGLRPRIESLANALIDQMQQAGSADLVEDFAYPLPINVIALILGIPPADYQLVRDYSKNMSEILVSPTPSPEQRANLGHFGEYIAALVEAKRHDLGNDLISQLLQLPGDRLTTDELKGTVALLVFAGHETTSNLIGNGLLALFAHPAQFDRIRHDYRLIPAAIEELLRYCGPLISAPSRFAATDFEFGGQQIHKGDLINVLIASGDRDDAQFSQPDVLDVTRAIDKHLAFGQGIHYCLGAPLARLEGQIALESLLHRLPDLHLAVAPEAIQWRGNLVLRGPASIPIAF